jgi:hypothetical protein
MNALKFKLFKLHNSPIRYEVIYKNLVRDVRKYYSQTLNGGFDLRRKRHNQAEYFKSCLHTYVSTVMAGKYQHLRI